MSKRRVFSREFKIEAVKLVTEQGYGVGQAAESLGISANSLRKWRQKFENDGQEAFPGKGKLTATDEEMRKLQEECRRLRMERDILKKATAYRQWQEVGRHVKKGEKSFPILAPVKRTGTRKNQQTGEEEKYQYCYG